MKKLFFLFAFLGIAVVVFHSCKKDKVQSPGNDGQEISYTAQELSIWRNLSDFNSKIKSGLKSEEFITPDSAMWYLEALYNVQETSNKTFADLLTFKRTYSLEVNENGTVNMSHVISIYNQMLADLNIEFEQIDSDYKYSVIGDLEEIPNRDGDFTMDFTIGIGINPLFYYDPITTSDNWRSGNMKGKCTNPQWDSDAGIQLKMRLNNPSMAQDTSANWIIVEYLEADEDDFPNRIVEEYSTIGEPCIEYDELEYYLKQGHYILHNTPNQIPKGLRPDRHVFRYMRLWTNGANPSGNIYWHRYGVFYGIPSHIPPID